MAENTLRDRKRDIITNPDGAGWGCFAIVPSDTLPLHDTVENVVVRKVYVGVSGDIAGKVANRTFVSGLPVYGDSDTQVFKDVPIGEFEMAFTEIHATDTTATNMIAIK